MSATRCFRHLRVAFAAGALVLVLAAPAPPAGAVTLPSGFALQTLPWTLDVPTDLAFLPDGRLLVAQKGGVVLALTANTQTVLWDGNLEVLDTDDRGLLGIAVDPNFNVNRYVYFLYSVDPDSNGVEFDNYDDTFARLTRYQVSAANPDTIDPASRTILLGFDWPHGFPDGSGKHVAARLLFAYDGSLLIGAGEGAHDDALDAGGRDAGLFTAGRTDLAQNIGSFRAQQLASLDGKILRIDPATGLGLPSNPYWDGNGASNRSRVWLYGFQHPFRFALKPGTGSTIMSAGAPGTLYVGDVGWNTWEEIDVAASGGKNFGWPCYEGKLTQPQYQAATPSACGCATLGTVSNPALASAPLLAIHHTRDSLSTPKGVAGACIVPGIYYTGTRYPPAYRNNLFVGDFMNGWIKVLATNSSDQFVALYDFATESDAPVAFAADPSNGDLWYIALATGLIHHIRFDGLSAVNESTPPCLSLSNPYPNPTRSGIRFALALPRAAEVRFEVYDLAGRRVWSDDARAAGPGSVMLSWDGSTPAGRAGAGLYFARVTAAGATAIARFAIVR